VKQLQHERIRGKLHQRRNRRMAEHVIGFAGHPGQIRDPVGHKPRDHIAGHIRIGPTGESGHRGGIDRRPRLGHIEPAIVRQTRQGDVDEAECRSLASSRDVAHVPSLNFDQPKQRNRAGPPAAVPACHANQRFPGNPRHPAAEPPRRGD
jgi:hypothetical protein